MAAMQCSTYRATQLMMALCFVALFQATEVAHGITTSLNLRLRTAFIGGLNCVELLSGDEVILRIRHESLSECNAAAKRLLDALHSAMMSSATDKDVSIQKVKGGYVIRIGDMEAAFIDHVIARNSRSSVDSLANSVAERLKELLKRPYLAVPLDEVIIGIGETNVVTVLGTACGKWKVSVTPYEIASASFNASTKMLHLTALKAGDGSVVITCDEIAKLTLPVRIRERAARLHRTPIAIVTETAPMEFVREAAINAVLNSVERKPGAQLRFELLSRSAPDTADEALTAQLKAHGAQYLPVDVDVEIPILRTPPLKEEAAALLVSNDPERIYTEQVLSASMVPNVGKPFRLLYHHVNASNSTLWLRLELFNASDEEAQVMVRFARAGPVADEIHSGYAAVNSFLRSWFYGAAFALQLPRRSIYVLSEVAMPRGTTATGLWEITPINSGAIGYQLRAVREKAQWTIIPLTTSPTGDAPVKVKQFANPMKLITAKHIIGGNWTFLHIGREPIRGLDTDHLHGNYGVIYRIVAEVENRRDAPSTYELVFMPNAGVARCVAIVDGELLSAPTMQPSQEFVLKRWQILPARTHRHEIYTMPLPASYYPVSLILRSL